MASRLKEVALLLLACAFAWLLVGTIDLVGPTSFRSGPSNAEVTRLRREVDKLNTTLRRVAVVDSVDKLLGSTTANLVLPTDSGFTPVVAEAVQRQIGVDSMRSRVALMVVHPNFHDGALVDGDRRSADAEFVVDSANGQPWCAAVHYGGWASDAGKYERFAQEAGRNRALGPCVFWARYGVPGAGVMSWLLDGGYEFADAPAHYVHEKDWQKRQNRQMFGMRPMYYGASINGDGCLSGRDSACAQAVLEKPDYSWWRTIEALPDGPPTFARYYSSSEVFGEADAAMVAHLEEEFGGDRFRKFWQSDAPVEQAFNAAFGMSLDAWVRSWGRARYGVEPLGPRVGLPTLLLSILSIGMLMGVALMIVQRRSVR